LVPSVKFTPCLRAIVYSKELDDTTGIADAKLGIGG
jgi:hypothetical protein